MRGGFSLGMVGLLGMVLEQVFGGFKGMFLFFLARCLWDVSLVGISEGFEDIQM